jgi:hypothetical protein
VDLDAIKQSMEKTNDLFNAEVFGKRNFDALDQIYTKGARILPPGALPRCRPTGNQGLLVGPDSVA